MSNEVTDLERLRDAIVGDGGRETEEWLQTHGANVHTILGTLTPGGPEVMLPEPKPKRQLHGGAVVVAIVSFLGCAAGTGWWYFADRPLLHDDFNDGWFNSTLWRSPPSLGEGIGVAEDEGAMHLYNRGYLVTQKDCPPPLEVSFDWSWLREGLEPTYADTLTVALRTTGEANRADAFRTADGLMITFDAWGGYVHANAGEGWVTVARTQSGAVPMPPKRWNRIRITDDGNRVQVWFATRGSPEEREAAPVLEFTYTVPTRANRIAFHNREKLAGINHESLIDNVTVKRLSPADAQK